jgi:hypothetical protein
MDTCPIFNVTDFLECYPEFDCYDPAQLLAVSKQANLLYAGFGGIRLGQRSLAYNLAVAHLTYLRFNPAMSGGQIKSIRNRNDAITYNVNANSKSSFDLNATIYGQMLQTLYSQQTSVGFTTAGYWEMEFYDSCGCSC